MSITVRPADPRDYLAIYEVHLLAFEGKNEAQLVEKLRRRSDYIPLSYPLLLRMTGK